MYNRLGVDTKKAHRLYELKSRNREESHDCFMTNRDLLLYHSIGAESPGENGSWVDFFTVNITLEEIQEISNTAKEN